MKPFLLGKKRRSEKEINERRWRRLDTASLKNSA